MGTIDKILNLLKMNKIEKSYSVKFYAEMKLEDGRIIATEDEQFMIGSKVFAVDDGDAEALAGGTYTMENGSKMTISDDSKIEDLGEEADSIEEENKEEASKEEMADAEDTDWAKTFEEMKDRVAALEEKVFGKKAEEETEEMSEEKTEMSVDVISELMTQVEELNSKIVELSKEPATDSINYNPEGSNVNTTQMDLNKLSIGDRAAYYINNK